MTPGDQEIIRAMLDTPVDMPNGLNPREEFKEGAIRVGLHQHSPSPNSQLFGQELLQTTGLCSGGGNQVKWSLSSSSFHSLQQQKMFVT